MELVPIKVRIELADNGHAKYPAFNALHASVRGGVDWSHYIDRHAGGWHYDRVCGHHDTDEANADVPDGHEHENKELCVQFGCILVPEAFAEAAVLAFPAFVTIIDEDSFASFYDERAHAHEDDDDVDLAALQKLKARIDAGDNSTATREKQAAALDRNNSRPGVKKNHRKRWADFKANRALKIRPAEASGA